MLERIAFAIFCAVVFGGLILARGISTLVEGITGMDQEKEYDEDQ